MCKYLLFVVEEGLFKGRGKAREWSQIRVILDRHVWLTYKHKLQPTSHSFRQISSKRNQS